MTGRPGPGALRLAVADTADWGLWNAVLPDGTAALDAARAYAVELATSTAGDAVATTKAQLYADLHRLDAAASVRESKVLLDAAMRTDDYREGVAALREKRPPRF